MKRIIAVVTVMTMMVAFAVPAFAASPNAGCAGQAASALNGFQSGLGGAAISSLARNGLVGDFARADKENCPGIIIPPQ